MTDERKAAGGVPAAAGGEQDAIAAQLNSNAAMPEVQALRADVLAVAGGADSGFLCLSHKPTGGGAWADDFFAVGDVEQVTERAAGLVPGAEVYLGQCVYSREGRQAVDVAALTRLPCDVDFQHSDRKRNGYPRREDSDRVIDAIDGAIPWRVSITDSGGGLYAFLNLTEPFAVETDGDSSRAILVFKGWQRAVAAAITAAGLGRIDDPQSLSLVLRPRGSWNHKSAVDAAVRPVRDGVEVDFSEVEAFLAERGFLADRKATPDQERDAALAASFTLARPPVVPGERIAAMRANSDKFAATWDHCRPDLNDQTTSGYTQSVVSHAVRAGHGGQESVDMGRVWREKEGADAKDHAWWTRTLRKALAGADEARERAQALDVLDETRTAPPDDLEARERALDAVSRLLGSLRLLDVTRQRVAGPGGKIEGVTYTLSFLTGAGETVAVELSAPQLLTRRLAAAIVFSATDSNSLSMMKEAAYQILVGDLARLAREVEAPPEASMSYQIGMIAEDYVQNAGVTQNLKEAVSHGSLLFRDEQNDLYLTFASFAEWVSSKRSTDRRVSNRELAEILESLGFVRVRRRLSEDARRPVQWRVPRGIHRDSKWNKPHEVMSDSDRRAAEWLAR